MQKEVCWNITARCNQKCKYCHRFLNIKELSFECNKKILNNLIKDEVKAITWTGGEALLLDYLDDLLEISWNNGIKNKLITNGKLLTNERIDKIAKFLDSITLSLDSTDDYINEKTGRGQNHFNNIKNILDYFQLYYPNVKIKINSVICSYTKEVDDLINFLNNYSIESWRVFNFMPLRELAKINKDEFSISEEDFKNVYNIIINKSKINDINYRMEQDMEDKYILILANGDLVVTQNKKDVKIGNALTDSIKVCYNMM